LSLPKSYSAITRYHLEEGGGKACFLILNYCKDLKKKKRQSQIREPGDTLPQCLGGRLLQEAVMERSRLNTNTVRNLRSRALGLWKVP
jgi:hypothetical protein